MSLQLINIGSAANDKSGDPLRTAGQKINSNFTSVKKLQKLQKVTKLGGKVTKKHLKTFKNIIV